MLTLNCINKRSIEKLERVRIDHVTDLYSPREGSERGSWFSIPDEWKIDLQRKNEIINKHVDGMIDGGYPIREINNKVSQLLNFTVGELEEMLDHKLLNK